MKCMQMRWMGRKSLGLALICRLWLLGQLLMSSFGLWPKVCAIQNAQESVELLLQLLLLLLLHYAAGCSSSLATALATSAGIQQAST